MYTATATEIIEALTNADVPVGFKNTLFRAVHSKVNANPRAVGNKKNYLQQCSHIEAFVPKSHWMALCDQDRWREHLPNMGNLFERLGLTNANEATYTGAIAVICMARMDANA